MITTQMIGNKITAARKKTALSQAQLAERLFISPQAVGKWERGESLPDIITLNRLAEILQVDLNYFSEGFTTGASEQTQAEFSEMQPATARDEAPALKWDMSRGNWVDADFSGLKHLHEKFSSSNMQRCKFIGSDLSGLLLSGNHVQNCDFAGSDISNSQVRGSHFTSNIFEGCSLEASAFSGSHVSGCNFTNADFTGMVFQSGGFEKNTLANAKWKRTAFKTTYLADMVFESTLEDCAFENCAFKRVTFKEATLKNTFFKCRSLKGIRFTDCYADRMTYEFLKNGKADVSGITLLPSEEE